MILKLETGFPNNNFLIDLGAVTHVDILEGGKGEERYNVHLGGGKVTVYKEERKGYPSMERAVFVQKWIDQKWG